MAKERFMNNSINTIIQGDCLETPEEFENRAGRPWSDDSAVYMRVGKNGWRTASYREAKFAAECCEGGVPCRIYCANSDAGVPKDEAENAVRIM
jgi:hypothetical protein